MEAREIASPPAAARNDIACQGCGGEAGTVHVSLEVFVTDREKIRSALCRFWLCEACREELMRRVRKGNGQSERMAHRLTHG